MKILVVTDAWHPQVNGVVRTLSHMAREARALDSEIEFLAPSEFRTLPMPSYPEIRLALPPPGAVARKLDAVKWDMLEEWSKTKRAPRHAAFLHEREFVQ